MKIKFDFFKQLLKLLTSDWQNYLDYEIQKLEELSKKDTNNSFLKEECYRAIANIKNFIVKQEYPLGVSPFNEISNASFLLTNIHILELDYLNQITVKAVKNMLQNNFKYIYDPEIYIIDNYEEPGIKNYGLIDKIAKGKVITFEDLNINYEGSTDEDLKDIDNILNNIRKLESELVADILHIIKFIHQFHFADQSITQFTTLSFALCFDNLEDFYENLYKINLVVPPHKYNLEYQPKNYNNFVNIEVVTWNRFLVKYQKLFDKLSEEKLEILFNICSNKDDFLKLLVSDSIPINTEKRNEIITSVISKYGNDKGSIHHITTQLFNICQNTTKPENIEVLIDYLDQWQGLPIYWCNRFDGLTSTDYKVSITGNFTPPENDSDNI